MFNFVLFSVMIVLFERSCVLLLQCVWSTPPYNEKKLNKAYRVSPAVLIYNLVYQKSQFLQDCRNVILIFSVRESGRFQGKLITLVVNYLFVFFLAL